LSIKLCSITNAPKSSASPPKSVSKIILTCENAVTANKRNKMSKTNVLIISEFPQKFLEPKYWIGSFL